MIYPDDLRGRRNAPHGSQGASQVPRERFALSPSNIPERLDLLRFYAEHATSVLLPFWMRALDTKNGGVFTCFNNAGDRLLSTDKYVWSQGRFLWLLSRLAALCREGVLDGDGERYLGHAGKAAGFLTDHAVLENGNCAFLLTEAGDRKESVAGQGYHTSFYADCFVIVGLSEYARVAADPEILESAVTLYDRVRSRLDSGNVRSEPYPLPEAHEAHSVTMIMLNTASELAKSLYSHGHQHAQEVRRHSLAYAKEVTEKFLHEDHTVREMLPKKGASEHTVLARHVNPGHTLESMWFVMETAAEAGKEEDFLPKTLPTIKKALELGWDRQHGGLLRFVDRNGGEPRGERTNQPYEQLILDTWDTKLWWPHSEALYATLLAAKVSGDPELYELHRKVHDYAFATFPNPNREVGEWIQIRDRRGRPMDKIVALPVKDPYHVLRNMLLMIELLQGGAGKR